MKTTSQYIAVTVFLISLTLLWPRQARAQAPVTLTDEQETYSLGLHVTTLHDPTGQLTLEQVMSPEYAAKFVPSRAETPNLGFHTTVWVRLQVLNLSSNQTWHIVYNWANMQQLDYYVIDSSQKLLEHVATGSARPFAQRQIPHYRFVFAPKFQPNQLYTLYLRLDGNYLMQVPLTLYSVAAWSQVNGSQNLELGLFFGALLIMLGYNFMLFLFLREASYLYYVAFLGSFVLYQSIALGIGIYVWGDVVWWNTHGAIISSVSYGVFALLFSHRFLEVKSMLPSLMPFIYFFIAFVVVILGLFIFIPSYPIIVLAVLSLFFVSMLIFGISLWAWWQGYRAARYLLLAWTVFGLTIAIFALTRLGLLPLNGLTESGNQVGIVLMMLLLSLALADRINLLQLAIQQANYYLSASEHKFRSLFENSKDAIIVTTMNGQVIEANLAALQLFGYSPDQNLTQIDLLSHYVHLADRQHLQAHLKREGYLKDYELQFRRHDNTLFEAMITVTVQQSDQHYIQTIIRDITYRKRNEQERLKLTAIQQELKLAGDIQNNFLLPPRPNWPDLEVICFTAPAKEVGGDFYAYQRLAEGYSLAIGDISGKGVPAAMFMGVSIAALQTMSRQGLSPTELLGQLDQTLLAYTQKSHQNCALCYADIKPISTHDYQLRIANAGCVTPIIKRNDGSVQWVEVGGMPLGTGFSQTWPHQQMELIVMKGDMVILTTDGVVEAKNLTHEMYGFPRLEATVKAAPTQSVAMMLDYIRNDLVAFVGEAESHDDVTLVVMQL